MEWEKIFANEASDEGICPKYTNSSKAQYLKTNNPIKKWAEDLNKNFLRGHTDSQQTQLIFIGKMKILNTAHFHWKNANQNHNEVSLHTSQNGHNNNNDNKNLL